MSEQSAQELIGEIADEYLSRKIEGHSPSITEYCRKYPKLEAKIRKSLSALDLLENVKPDLEISNSVALSSPQKIGEYSITRLIGRGGMGLVYEAIHESLGRRVALKLISRRVSDDSNAIARFEREARAIAKLHHTNIVPLFEVGEDDGQLFLAMQLIPGKSLDQVVSELRKEPGDTLSSASTIQSSSEKSDTYGSGTGSNAIRSGQSAVRRHFHWIAKIGMQAADALSYAHKRSIIHRDVKPSNLLLDDSGVVWLTDFGLAKTDDDELTQTGELVGTLRYMAPELLRGAGDERADIYALGATLYELVALSPAYGASDRLEVLSAINNSMPKSLRDLNPSIPRDLETIILKAMDRDPSSRYQSARLLSDDLARFVNDEPIKARRIQPIEHLVRWSRRNKGLSAALTAAFVLLIMLVGVLGWTSIRQSEMRKVSDDLRSESEARGKVLEQNLYFAQMNLAGQAALQPFGTTTIKGRLAEWYPDSGEMDLRNWEWYYLYALSHREASVSEPLGFQFCWGCDHSPDGTRIVNTVNNWGIQIRDAQDGSLIAEKQLLSGRYVDWSPDGKRIAVGYPGNFCSILDAETLDILLVLDVPNGLEAKCLKWHPDSRLLAEISNCNDDQNGKQIRIHDAYRGGLMFVMEVEAESVSWFPDGEKLACSLRNKTQIWDMSQDHPQLDSEVDGGHAVWSPDGSMLAVMRSTGYWDAISGKRLSDATGAMCWSPDSDRIAVGTGHGAICVYAADSAILLRKFLGHVSEISSISWSGELLASTGLKDRTVRTWKLREKDDNQLAVGDPAEHHLRLSGDGTRIAATAAYGNTLFLWTIHGELLSSRKISALNGVRAISFSGTRMAFVKEKTELAIWDSESDTLLEIPTVKPISPFLGSMDWHRDGTLAGATVNDIILWDEDGRQLLKIPLAHDGGGIYEVEWNCSGSRFATIGTDDVIKIWNASTGKEVRQWKSTLGAPGELRFSYSGKYIGGAYPNEIILWNVETGQVHARLDETSEQFHSLDWSPDDSRIVTSSPTSITIWDVASGKVALSIEAPAGVQNVCWSSDGRHIVAGCRRGVRIYDATRGYELNQAPK